MNKKALTLADVAVLADEFVLTHRVSFYSKVSSDQNKRSGRNRWTFSTTKLGTVSTVPL